MRLFKNVTVIEDSVNDSIDICDKNLFCEPVDSLDELLDLEESLASRRIDYAIAEFDYPPERNGKRSSTWQRGYSIFVILKYGRIESIPRKFNKPSSYYTDPDDTSELTTHVLHNAVKEKEERKQLISSEDF